MKTAFKIMLLFLLVLCFSQCLTAPSESTAEPTPTHETVISVDDFRERLEHALNSYSERFERERPYVVLNKRKSNCFAVEKSGINLNFTCVQTNMTISLDVVNVTVLLNNTELYIKVHIDVECSVKSKVEAVGNINGVIVQKDGVLTNFISKMTNKLDSKYIYREPYIRNLFLHDQNITLSEVKTTLDMDIGQENIEVIQNSIQSQLKESFDDTFSSEKRKLRHQNALKEVNLRLLVKPMTLDKLLNVIQILNDPSILFAREKGAI